MKVIYRVSPFLSTHPNPLGKNKIEILHECWQSFLFSRSNQEVIILNDSLPTDELWRFGDFEVVDVSGLGNEGTFHAQLDYALTMDNHEKVFFVEDDYLWMPGALDILESALDEMDLVSPYDHPGHYIEPRFKFAPKRIILHENRTYRDGPSNTLTFACKAFVVKQNIDEIKKWGIRDHELFSSLPVDLWIPVPSLATHLVEGLLAPNVDWL